MLKISVIICTHNPRESYLKQCLAALEGQSLSQDFWELIIIDNCSDKFLIEHWNLIWHQKNKIIREDKLGLTPARLRGIREAKGDLLVFIDDDNVLDLDYLETALKISKEKSFLGAWSGQCIGVFEELPPEWTKRYWGNLVLREFEEDVWSNLPRLAETMPCGAGLCIRREVAQYYLELHKSGKRSFQFDRSGGSLLSGGDNDLAACACAVGLGVGLIASLKLKHLITSDRLTVDYHKRLAEGIHFSSTLLDAEWGTDLKPRSLLGQIIDFARTFRLSYPHKQILHAAFKGRNKALKILKAQKD
jgi:glycosyltransferase involved in cell wall biosynthesis